MKLKQIAEALKCNGTATRKTWQDKNLNITVCLDEGSYEPLATIHTNYDTSSYNLTIDDITADDWFIIKTASLDKKETKFIRALVRASSYHIEVIAGIIFDPDGFEVIDNYGETIVKCSKNDYPDNSYFNDIQYGLHYKEGIDAQWDTK